MGETAFPVNLHYVPDEDWTAHAFTVLRAGKVVAGPGYGVRRPSQVGQDVLFCLSGSGVVDLGGQRIDVQAGQLVWLANEAPHAHIADPRTPWTLLWFRFDGPRPAALRSRLFGEGLPRVTVEQKPALVAWFDRLFAALERRDASLDFRLNQLVGDVFAFIDQALASNAGGARGAADPLAAVVAAVRMDLSHPWSTDDLARLTDRSPSQTRRLFQKHLRESPRRWLIRERLIAAQTWMIHDNAPLARVAELCGFCDVYHFGREFKRLVGTSPAAWRRNELGSKDV